MNVLGIDIGGSGVKGAIVEIKSGEFINSFLTESISPCLILLKKL